MKRTFFYLGTLLIAVIPNGDLWSASFSRLSVSGVTGVSADGATVVGGSNSVAFLWTEQGGVVEIGVLDHTATSSLAYAVSGDGTVVVGESRINADIGNLPVATRWKSEEGMVSLGGLSDEVHSSRARGASFDGSVIVGAAAPGGCWEAFRWTQATGMIGLGGIPGDGVCAPFGPDRATSLAFGVSADGSVIVGQAHSLHSGSQAFVWTDDEGMVGLGRLRQDDLFSRANAVSADGSVFVGVTGREAFRWDESDEMVGLGHLGAGERSAALAVSADGTVIVGSSDSGAFIWDELNGMRSVWDVLTDAGLDVSGWNLKEAVGVSSDGTVVVGNGRDPQGDSEGWIAVVPTPLGDFNSNRILDASDVGLLTEQVIAGLHPSMFDLNNDSLVDNEDHRIWVRDLKLTWFGDADLDGEFGSGDLVIVFEAGKYELDVAAIWSEGDWDADGRFGTGDLVAAFQDGGYELGPRVAANAVPEPTSFGLLMAALLCVVSVSRSRRKSV